MKFEIKSWFDGGVLFAVEAENFKLAVIAAVASRADLSGANLSGANLSRADLYGADLSRADLSGANLSGANLSGANLSRADLSGANLYGADLSGADLSGANLSGANLSGANLSRADLSGADLYGADLYGEKLTKNPIQLLGLKWPILITEVHIKIGCEVHKAAEWEKFKDSRITLMDSSALEWWNNHKKLILNLHKLHAGSKP